MSKSKPTDGARRARTWKRRWLREVASRTPILRECSASKCRRRSPNLRDTPPRSSQLRKHKPVPFQTRPLSQIHFPSLGFQKPFRVLKSGRRVLKTPHLGSLAVAIAGGQEGSKSLLLLCLAHGITHTVTSEARIIRRMALGIGHSASKPL